MKTLIKRTSILNIFLVLWSCTSEAVSSSQLQKELRESSQWELSLFHVREIQQRESIIIVDIRSKESYEKGHVFSSINISLPDLPQTILEKPGMLPKDRPIYVICCAQDRNALFATLPLRAAGYEAYNVTGGGVDAWIYLRFPTEKGSTSESRENWKSSLNMEERAALSVINPSYHMMKAGRSYLIKREGIETAVNQGQDLFVVEIISENQTIEKSPSYVKEREIFSNLPMARWLENHPKEETVYLIGDDDKELVLGVVALRMLDYDAVAAVKE